MNSPYPGTCGDCCSCPQPLLALSNISASKSKCGIVVVTTSSPYIYYLAATRTVTFTCAPNPGAASDEICSGGGNETGNYTMDPSSCAQTATYSGSWNSSGQATSSGVTATRTDVGTVDASTGVLNYVETDTFSNGSPTRTADHSSNPLEGDTPSTGYCTACSYSSTDTGMVGSSPYATSTLMTNTVAALPSTWPAFSILEYDFGAELASAELASTEASYSIEQGKYYFLHPVPPFGGYELTWVERFTPDGGGTPVDTARSYTWDGTTPSGYNPADNTTWPFSDTHTVTQPGSNGSVSIANLKLICGGTTTQLVP